VRALQSNGSVAAGEQAAGAFCQHDARRLLASQLQHLPRWCAVSPCFSVASINYTSRAMAEPPLRASPPRAVSCLETAWKLELLKSRMGLFVSPLVQQASKYLLHAASTCRRSWPNYWSCF
jgi:hypothetical protein